jgi:membrane protein YdbS with pleckstrin-like domain
VAALAQITFQQVQNLVVLVAQVVVLVVYLVVQLVTPHQLAHRKVTMAVTEMEVAQAAVVAQAR